MEKYIPRVDVFIRGDGLGAARIPKKIHFIWLGSKFPAAKYYERFYKTWEALHPTWEIILWDDERVKALIQEKELLNAKAFKMATNYGEKSDILRLELLYRFGGIYVDVDFKCLKPFDTLLDSGATFFVGESNVPGASDGKVELNNALIGASPNHPILAKLMEAVQPDPKILVAQMMSMGQGVVRSSAMSTITRTGPIFLTNVLLHPSLNLFQKYPGMLILPKVFFYPVPNHVDFNVVEHGDREISRFYTEDTYAVHRWGKSWQHPTLE